MADAMPSPRTHRASSVSSAGTSRSAVSLSFAPRFMPKPEPQYISRVAAGEHVDHITRSDHHDFRSPSASPVPQDHAIFTESALALLNHFLDALLYNFLAKARSTSMSTLRVAISEVLKARLARDALSSADEDIQGLIDEAEIDGIEEEPLINGRASSRSPAFHLEQAFKVMRLRVMVFIKLGELDDEDEMEYFDEDEDTADLSILNGPTAVFLASVLEYLAERLLDTAGEAAWVRSRNKNHKRTPTIRESRELEDIDPDRLVVEETDVEKIALNTMLGRLWRTWRKTYRVMTSPPAATSPQHTEFPRSPSALQSPRSLRRSFQEHGVGDSSRILAGDRHLTLEDVPEGEVSEHDIAANIPLPMTENDVNEIEVPGVAKEMYEESEEPLSKDMEKEQWLPRRPSSAIFTMNSEEDLAKQTMARARSNSAPHLVAPGISFFFREAETSDEGYVLVSEDESGQPMMEEVAEFVPAKPAAEQTVEEEPAVSEEMHDPSEAVKGEMADTKAEPKERDERESRGIVAGVLTGATALVSSAVATIAGTRHDDRHEDKDDGEDGDDEEEAAVAAGSVHSDGLRSHPVQREESQGKQEVSATERKEPTATTPEVTYEQERQPSRTSSEQNAGTFEAEPEYIRQQGAPAGQSEASEDAPQDEVVDEDYEAIGVARTSDVKIQSQSQSPPPTPKQNGFFYGSAHAVEQARDARASLDRSGMPHGMYDEYNLTNQQHIPQYPASNRYQPYAAQSSQSVDSEKSGSIRGTDKPQPVPYPAGQTAYRDSAFQPAGEPKRSSKDSVATGRAQKGPPLQTGPSVLEKDDTGRPSSSAYSARSSATTPRSTRGSSSSIQPKTLRVSDEQRERDFDALIATAEPRVFSLTPEHLRDPQLDEGAHNNTRPSTANRITRSGSSSSKRSPPRTGSRAGSGTVQAQQQKASSPTTRPGSVPRPSLYRNSQALSTRPSVENSLPGRKSGFVPREARVVTERLSDLADYMRSTAPASDSQATPFALATSPGSSKATTPRKSGPRLEPRGASVRGGGGSDELIDFIRRGPPGGEDGEHRIPRSVAPFRTTMDSDDFKDLSSSSAGATVVNGSKQPPRRQSPTLGSTSQPAYSTVPNSHNTLQPPAAAGGGPVRKQRRVRDPYAIDSDDEEDLLTALPPSNPRKAEPHQESLAEFLRAVEPPNPDPRPAANGGSGSVPTTTTTSKAAAPRLSAASSSSAPRSADPRQRYEARAAGRTSTFGEAPPSTIDMADFLRSSGPPDPASASASAPAPPAAPVSSRAGRSGPGPGSSSPFASAPPSQKKASAASAAAAAGRKFFQRRTYLESA